MCSTSKKAQSLQALTFPLIQGVKKKMSIRVKHSTRLSKKVKTKSCWMTMEYFQKCKEANRNRKYQSLLRAQNNAWRKRRKLIGAFTTRCLQRHWTFLVRTKRQSSHPRRLQETGPIVCHQWHRNNSSVKSRNCTPYRGRGTETRNPCCTTSFKSRSCP